MEDLFETPHLIPTQIADILSEYDETSYEINNLILKRIEILGYTFDYGLDGAPYNLRKIQNS